MAEKKITTRIVLTHDEYSALSTKKLKNGEVVLAKVGATEANGKVSEPIWMMKVGDGTSTVANCPWLVAPAADVYDWAKKSSLNADDLPAIPGDKLGITVEVTGNGNAVTDASWNANTKTLTLTKGETFLKASDFVDTTYAAGTKLDLDDTTFNHETTERNDTTSQGNAEFGKTIEVIDSVTSDETGHITAVNKRTITLPTPEEISLPTVDDTEVAGQVVVEVDQNAGEIDVKRKSIEVVHEDGQIYLTIGGKKIGTGFSDAEFVKDGFLSNVDKDIDTNEIVFTWNTDAGVTETRIDIDDLVEVYTAGKGITVEDFIISHAKPTTVATNVTKTARTYVDSITFDEFGHVTAVTTSEEVDQDLSGYKKVQTAKADPTASGKSLTFIDTISQNTQGVITATKKNVNLDNYALKSEIPTDLGVTKITSNDTTSSDDSNVSGLKITPSEGTGEVNIEIDDTIIFVLDGGNASDLD